MNEDDPTHIEMHSYLCLLICSNLITYHMMAITITIIGSF